MPQTRYFSLARSATGLGPTLKLRMSTGQSSSSRGRSPGGPVFEGESDGAADTEVFDHFPAV